MGAYCPYMTLPKVSRTSRATRSTRNEQIKLQAKISPRTHSVLSAVAAARRISVGALIDQQTDKHLAPLLDVEGLMEEPRNAA